MTINGSTTQQAAEITLGYRDFDIAVVPVSVTQQTGAVTQIKSTANPDRNQSFEDALSVLGQFEANTKTANPEVGLGKFFATGTAAKVLADGFKAKLSNGPPSSQGQLPQPPQPPQPVQPPQPAGPAINP